MERRGNGLKVKKIDGGSISREQIGQRSLRSFGKNRVRDGGSKRSTIFDKLDRLTRSRGKVAGGLRQSASKRAIFVPDFAENDKRLTFRPINFRFFNVT